MKNKLAAQENKLAAQENKLAAQGIVAGRAAVYMPDAWYMVMERFVVVVA